MHVKILKETASQLKLLAIESDHTFRTNIEDNLSEYFMQICFAAHSQEAQTLYQATPFDVVLIDIDTLGDETDSLISYLQRVDPFQAIAVCSERYDDNALLFKLLNSDIAGFISKPSDTLTIHKIVSKICAKIHDRQMLLHYLYELEKAHEDTLATLDGSKELCTTSKVNRSCETLVEEDDLESFYAPSASAPTHTVDNSMYQDYFSFLDVEDKEELRDFLNEIDAILLNAFSYSGTSATHVVLLGHTISRYGNVLLHYQFFSDMGTAIIEFGTTISEASETISTQSEDFQLLIGGFCSSLLTFMHEVWEHDCDDPKIFNDSIVNDVLTITAMIHPETSADNCDELVFF